jgi:hypothetical protein
MSARAGKKIYVENLREKKMEGPHFFFFFTFHLISSHAKIQNPRQSPCLRKVIRRSEKKTMNLVATTFASQPICNATWAAHTLRSDKMELSLSLQILKENKQMQNFKADDKRINYRIKNRISKK